jgi:UDP-N-acetylmuramyl pentapeptide phosphotransferase/UDP-N-acetylglucosamine-1-phosphate transferase
MGDSGSLSIGLVMSILSIKYVEFVPNAESTPFIRELFTPVMAMAIISYALTDTFRIFIWRAIRGVSPFSADRNHLHHLLIDSGRSHAKTVLFIYTANLSVMGVAVITRLQPLNISFAITGSYAFVLMMIPWILKRIHLKKKGVTGKTRRLDSVEAA